jgi:hypothetical protein
MSKTLEQVVLALPCDGATTLAIIGALEEAGILDATVYGLCEPDCTGTVSVVTKELRERAIEEAGRAATLNSIEAHCMAREPLEDVVDAVLVESTSAPYAMAGDTIAILEDDDE